MVNTRRTNYGMEEHANMLEVKELEQEQRRREEKETEEHRRREEKEVEE